MKISLKQITSIIFIVTLFILISFYNKSNTQIKKNNSALKPTTQLSKKTWTCSMHPQIKLPKPGLCPICNMSLIPLDKDTNESESNILTMSDSDQKLAEIQTVKVKRKKVHVEINLVGKVFLDETKIKSITSWFPYRVDRLFVDYTGITVKKGDHLAKIYSPELLTAQEELLEAQRRVENNNSNESEFIIQSNSRALKSAKEKLRLWGLLPSQIDQIISKGTVSSEHLTINSPFSGTIIHKGINEGEYTEVGTKIFNIADLTKLWVILDAYEKDLSWIRYGQKVTFQTEAYPGKKFEGIISFIDPMLNSKTRTVKVRVHVDNENQMLKPEMFVRATVLSKLSQRGKVIDPSLEGKWICPMHPKIIDDIHGQCKVCEMDLVTSEQLGFQKTKKESHPLVIPHSAVLYTGKRSIVYIKLKNKDMPSFKAKEITIGPQAGDYFTVLDGLKEGEEIVTNGNFKIDSALQILAKPSMMSISSTKKSSAKKIDSNFISSLQPLYKNYFKVSNALSKNNYIQATVQFTEMATELKLIPSSLLTDSHDIETWKKESKSIETAIHKITKTNEKKNILIAFNLLSKAIINIQNKWGHTSGKHFLIYCPMALNGKGAHWLQRKKGIYNPYLAETMLSCGQVEKEFSSHKENSND